MISICPVKSVAEDTHHVAGLLQVNTRLGPRVSMINDCPAVQSPVFRALSIAAILR